MSRGRIDDLTGWLGREPEEAGGAAGPRVGQVKTLSALPPTAGSWFVMSDLAVGGTEAEGAAASFAPTGGEFRAYNLGPTRPAIGDRFLCVPVDGRYVFTCGA